MLQKWVPLIVIFFIDVNGENKENFNFQLKFSFWCPLKISSGGLWPLPGPYATTPLMLKAAETVCPEKRQAFVNISLTRNTVADRISDLAGDLDNQLKRKVKSFIAFSVAIDESTDITDVVQLAIFIRGVGDTLKVTEEFVELVPMLDTTTASDIFTALIGALERVGVDWSRVVSLATDGVPSMTGRKAGIGTKFREKVQDTNGGCDFWTFHCILHQEALCCKSLRMNNVMEVVVRTLNFIRSRGMNHRQFESLLREKDHNYGLPYRTPR